MRKAWLFMMVALLGLGSAACGNSDSGDASDEGGWSGDGDGDGVGDGDGDGDGWGDGDGDGDSGGDGDGDGEAGDGDGDGDVEPGQLTAGEWRDLSHWEFWRGLFDDPQWAMMEGRWAFFTANRFAVVVTDGAVEVADARVTLVGGDEMELWSARTDNLGRAELFAGLFGQEEAGPYTLVVEAGGAPVVVEASPTSPDEPMLVEVPGATQAPAALDLMFVIDTTSSMGDELSYLQAELADVIQRVQQEVDPELELRLSVNFYRDTSDEYLVRSYPFTADPQQALSQLAAQSAGGGGDYPEAVEIGLADGVQGHAWSESARARLLFLVLDAPPHHGAGIVEDLHESARAAAEQGIRIIPLTASGTDKDTEFLMRFLDVSSGGTYTFLTDHSGIGGAHIEPTIGPYDVEYLNDLLVRVVTDAAQ